jgi:hypothetical protein
VLGFAREQRLGQLLQVAQAGPAGGGQLVGVPGHAGCRELVDVGEDQLGEVRDGGGGLTGAEADRGQLVPRDARPDPVRRQQRVEAAAVARLAAAQRVRALERRPQRGLRIRPGRTRDQLEEGAQRGHDGALDLRTQLAGERVGVRGHLGRDGIDGLQCDVLQPFP